VPSFEAGYDRFLEWLTWAAAAATGRLQTGSVTFYLRMSLGVMSVMILAALMLGGGALTLVSEAPPGIMVVVVGLIAAATALLPFTGKRLLLITALGVTGAGVSLIFALYGAIDVAITQLMVETLVVVIIAVALLKLPPIRFATDRLSRRRRMWNLGISTLLGVASTFAVLTIMQGDLDLRLTRYFEANLGGGRAWAQHRERHPRRLPRSRHHGRDRGGRHCGTGGAGAACGAHPALKDIDE
jgi:multicomponent Na+:H+ antiporter subunit A